MAIPRLLPPEKARYQHVAAMRAIALNIPDPAVYAGYLPARLALALCGAWRRGKSEYVVNPFDAAVLRPYGLVGYGSDALTAFGLKVRKALMVDLA